jgi:transposase
MTPVLFIPTLKRRERTRLENHLRRTRDVRYADRLRAVLWSSERCPVPEIGHRLGKHPSTVQRWLHDYRRFRLRGLELGKSPGRPRCIDADGEECLRQAVLTQPRDLNHRFTRWSIATLTAHLFRELHLQISQDSVRRTLRRLGFTYKRPKLSLRHRQSRRAVRQAKAARDAAAKKGLVTPSAMSSSLKMSVSSTSIPA